MTDILSSIKQKLKSQTKKIVFPEATDHRVLEAVANIKTENIIEPVLIGNPTEIKSLAKKSNIDINDIDIIDPENYSELDQMKQVLVERRKGKITESDAAKVLKDENYFGIMLLQMGKVDGLVSGAAHSTADTVRPALQIIKTKPGFSKTSGSFLMHRGDEKYVMADSAINIDPTAEDLAEIAIQSAKTAELFGIDPKVALLSFSTKGSGKGEAVTKVQEAVKIAHKLDDSVKLDGELQFDAAVDPEVAKLKAPESSVAGKANVFIFPELQSGNIGYKIAQRLGGFEAIGPILQGMNKPVSDLSRGASVSDIQEVAIITAGLGLTD